MRSIMMIAGLATAMAMVCLFAFVAPCGGQDSDKPEKGFRVILAVYAGKPDPEWFLTEGPIVEKISSLIQSLEVSKEKFFDYDKWNRLGYAGFWVIPQGMEGMPAAIHLWRDEAYFPPGEEDKEPGYAVGATDLYDVLVELAEREDLGKFFIVYKRERERPR